jgi:hypothetical protein
MYTTAKMKHDQQHYPSVTDAYKYVVKSFLMNIDQPEQLNLMLHDLKKWYGAWIKHQYADHALITDSIIKEYIPEDYFSQLSSTDKDQIFIFIFTQSIKRIGMQIFQINNLRKICDDHDNKNDNEKYFQDIMLTIMIEIRTVLYNRFMNSAVNNGKTDNHTILLEQMKQDLLKMTHENYKMKMDENKYKAIIQHNIKQKENLQLTIDDLTVNNNKLQQAIQAMRRSRLHSNPPKHYPDPALGTPKPKGGMYEMYDVQPTQKDDINIDTNAFEMEDEEPVYINPNDLDEDDDINEFEKMTLENQAVEELKKDGGNSEFSRDLKRGMDEINQYDKVMDAPPQLFNANNPINQYPQKTINNNVEIEDVDDDDDEIDDAAARARDKRLQKRIEFNNTKTRDVDEDTVLRGDFN